MSLPTDLTGQIAPPGKQPELTATLWEDEGCVCFQVKVKGLWVTRRDDNNMINGTKLLNVTSLSRGRRDWILKAEQVKQIVKFGPTYLKGVWIPFERALALANDENITENLYPLFVHGIAALLYHPISQRVQDLTRSLPKLAEQSAQMVAPKQLSDKSNVAGKEHRRSRSGCYTCRLRRKKCDEGQICCRACRNLGIQCEYKQPLWWNDSTLRRKQKERIKLIIKRTKQTTYDSMKNSHTHAPSVDTPYSIGNDLSQFDMYSHVLSSSYDAITQYQEVLPPLYGTESQRYVNDFPMWKDPSTSSFSTYRFPPVTAEVTFFTKEHAGETELQLLDPQLQL